MNLTFSLHGLLKKPLERHLEVSFRSGSILVWSIHFFHWPTDPIIHWSNQFLMSKASSALHIFISFYFYEMFNFILNWIIMDAKRMPKKVTTKIKSNQPWMVTKSLEVENVFSEKIWKSWDRVILKTLIKGTRLKSGQGPSVQPFSLGSIVDIHISWPMTNKLLN